MEDPALSGTWRCAACGEVIGVYEPMVILLEGAALQTSRACAPEEAGTADGLYHRACHAAGNDRPTDALGGSPFS